MPNDEPNRKDTETSERSLERVPASEARDRLTELMNRAGYRGEVFVLTRNGEDIAFLIGGKDFERLRAVPATADAAA